MESGIEWWWKYTCHFDWKRERRMTDSGERILPLPYLPTYIARWVLKERLIEKQRLFFFVSRPKQVQYEPKSFNSIFANNWQKAWTNYSKKHQNVFGSPYIDVDLDSVSTLPKEYDTYKSWYQPQYDLNSLVNEFIRNISFLCNWIYFVGSIQSNSSIYCTESYNVKENFFVLRNFFLVIRLDKRARNGLDFLMNILIVFKSIILYQTMKLLFINRIDLVVILYKLIFFSLFDWLFICLFLL